MAAVVVTPVPDNGIVMLGTWLLKFSTRLPVAGPLTVGQNRIVNVKGKVATTDCGTNPDLHWKGPVSV